MSFLKHALIQWFLTCLDHMYLVLPSKSLEQRELSIGKCHHHTYVQGDEGMPPPPVDFRRRGFVLRSVSNTC